MELHQIRYFLETAETLNFTRASEQCNVSQPALTRAIKKLEDELGGQLFRRERKKTHLTELGKVMQQYLSKVDSSTKEATLAAQKVLNLEKATLNIGIVCTLDPTHLIGFLLKFRKRHPGIEISLRHLTPKGFDASLLSGEVDCAILGLPIPLKERFDAFPLYKKHMVLAYSKKHRFHKKEKIILKDLKGESYLDRLDCEFRDTFFQMLEEQKIGLKVFYRSDREDWIQNMVASGMGICMIPQNSFLRSDIESKKIDDVDLIGTVQLVTVSGHRRSAALDVFINLAKDHKW